MLNPIFQPFDLRSPQGLQLLSHHLTRTDASNPASPVTAGARVQHFQLSDGSTYRVGTIVTSRLRLVFPVCVTLWMVGLLLQLWIY